MLVVHGLAFYVLFYSGISLFGKVFGTLSLFLVIISVINHPIPQSRWLRLDYLNKKWVLTDNTGATREFTCHRVLADLGLFFVLHLSSDKLRQTGVIFRDQIHPDHYRTLRILERIN